MGRHGGFDANAHMTAPMLLLTMTASHKLQLCSQLATQCCSCAVCCNGGCTPSLLLKVACVP